MKTWRIFLILIALAIFGSSCDKLFEDEQPTKSSMEGVWMVEKVVNEEGQDITNKVAFPIVGIHLSRDRTIISTAGPLIMYIVYGENKYTEIASKIDQVFNYTTLDFNGGEFFIGGGVQKNFTLEMKLEGLPGQKALTTLLEMIGIGNDYLDVVVYHKFHDISVEFYDDYNSMIWTIDEQTSAVYNTKDNYGNYVLWYGWPTNSFQKCQILLRKQVKDLKDLIRDYQ